MSRPPQLSFIHIRLYPRVIQKKIPTLNYNSKELQEKFSKFREFKYREEINYHKFLKLAHVAAYLTGIFGYKKSLANADLIKSEWSILTPSIIIPTLNYPFVVIYFINALRRDIYTAITVVPVLLAGALALVEAATAHFLRTEMKNLLAISCKLWNNELKIGVDDVVVKEARKYLLMNNIYFLVVLLALTPRLIPPFQAIISHYFFNGNDKFLDIRVLPTEYPFAVDTIWKWIFCNIWDTLSTVFVFSAFLAMDSIFFQLCALTSLEAQVMNNEFREVVKLNDRRDNDRRLVNRLYALGRKHCQILILWKRINNLFSPIMLAIVISASISLCICVITLEKDFSESNFLGAVGSLMFFFSCFIQTVGYCNATEELNHWLANISNTIYESQWIGQSKKFQRMLVLIMLRSQGQFKFKACGLYIVDRIRLKEIMLAAFNLLTILRNTRSSNN